MNPWAKTRVTLLFERPAGDAPHRLKYVDEVIATINPSKASATAARVAGAAAPAPGSQQATSAPVEEEEDEFMEPVTGYLKLLADARDKARGVAAMSNMNQIGLAIGMYAEANGGRMPASFDDLRTVMPAIDGVLVNQRTKENPGFIYERPAGYFAGIADPADTPILWESLDGQKDPDGSILYADGHIESRY